MKAKEIAAYLKGRLKGDKEIEISGVASLENSRPGDLVFVEKNVEVKLPEKISATCVLVPNKSRQDLANTTIEVPDPKLAFAKISELLHPPKKRLGQIHESAVISEKASIGKETFIGAFCCIGENSKIGDGTQIRAGAKVGDGVSIGKNCVLHPGVFVEEGCTIGDNVVLHAGVIIGAEGFGYVRDKEAHVKFPQIGTVVVENDVEIGANSCVDRGALGETRIGEGTKIDNLVQVAHNVKMGRRVIVAALSGISGSTTIEDDCVIGGQVGIADHVTLKKGTIIGAKSAVYPGKIVRGGVWGGIPVKPLDDYKKQNAHLRSIPRIKKEIKKLKLLMKELEKP